MRRSEILGTVADLPTRRDAEMVLSDRLRRVNSADYHPRSCCSFRAFVQEWEAQARPTLKYATQEHYKYVVNSHLLPVFGNVQLRLISRESIQIFLAGKLKEGLSWRTLKHFRTTLGTILGTAKFWGYIEDNPVSENQTSATWATARKNGLDAGAAEFLARKAAGTVPIACLAVALDRLTNRRLLALRWQDIDLQAGHLRVSRTLYEGRFDEPKTRSSVRTVPLSAKGVEILVSVRPGAPKQDALVFCSKKGLRFAVEISATVSLIRYARS